METADLKTVTRRFYDEIFTRGNLGVIDELVHDDFVEHEELPGLPPGREGLRFFATAIREGFPDLVASVEDIIVEDNKAVGEGGAFVQPDLARCFRARLSGASRAHNGSHRRTRRDRQIDG